MVMLVGRTGQGDRKVWKKLAEQRGVGVSFKFFGGMQTGSETVGGNNASKRRVVAVREQLVRNAMKSRRPYLRHDEAQAAQPFGGGGAGGGGFGAPCG